MSEQSIKEQRIRNITQLYYSREEIQKAIFEFATNREISPRYFEGFGKRPDNLQYPSDVFELVKKGATSLHCSEELWSDALSLTTEMNEKQFNESESTPSAAHISAMSLPLYGRIAAGTPIEALRDESNTIEVPPDLVGTGEHYALEVEGDSMIDAGIHDGDHVIIQRCTDAENGAIVVALVDREEVTLKRLRRKGASIALEPANKDYETRIFGPDRVRVQGRLVGLLRKY